MIITKKQIKNRVLIILLLLISLFTLTSCKESKTIDNVIAIAYLKDNIYLINSDNESLLLEGFDLIQESIDDYMYVRKDNKYGYIDIHGKEIIEPKYSKAYAMREEKAVVVLNDKHIIINNKGEKLYTLPSNVTSRSYFSNNKLVIEKDGKFNYLTFDPENNTFILPSEFLYDYAGIYSEGYGVVGIETHHKESEDSVTTTTIKYNYLNLEEYTLFPEFMFDEAEPFTNGFAKVGVFKQSVAVEGEDYEHSSNLPNKYYDLTVYNYIMPDGKYIIDQLKGGPIECHYGSINSEGIIVTAVFKYFNNDEIDNNLFKSYTFYTTSGNRVYETCFIGTKNTNINIFWPTDLIKMGEHHIFALGKGSTSWSIRLAVDNELNFLELPIDINLEEGWVSELANEYYLKDTMVKFYAQYPFYLTDFVRPSYTKDNRPLMIAQVNFNDNAKYGILQLNYDEEIAKNAENARDPYSIYYIIPPIYDRIVF